MYHPAIVSRFFEVVKKSYAELQDETHSVSQQVLSNLQKATCLTHDFFATECNFQICGCMSRHRWSSWQWSQCLQKDLHHSSSQLAWAFCKQDGD